MFALRGIAVSLSVFVLVYAALSLVVCMTWQKVRHVAARRPAHSVADLFLALRMFPLVTAVVITVAFTIPSFLLLEPRTIDEPLGIAPLLLGSCGAGVVLAGGIHIVRAMWRVSRTVSAWTSRSEPILSRAPLRVLRIFRAIPPMTAIGIVRPRILVSSSAEFLLAERELRAAMNHEVEHVRRRDNLRKLLLQFVAFPGMRALEAAWLEATEMAADDAAVNNASEALDLAAALIKLSRLPAEPGPDLSAALVRSPGAIMNARIERLLAWSDRRVSSSRALLPWYGAAVAASSVAVLAVTYSYLLVRIHTATEWFVR